MHTTVRRSTGLVCIPMATIVFAILAVGPASAGVNMENIFGDEDVQESSRQEDGLHILDYRFHLGEDQPVLVTVIHTDTGHGAGKMLYDGSQRLYLRIFFTADVERFTSGGRDEKEYPYHGGIGTGIWDPNDEFISHYWNAIGFNVWSYSFYAGSNSGWTDWRPPSAGEYTLRAVTGEWSHAVFEMTVTVESPLDLDNDGIPDDEDECPASKAASPGTSLNVDQFGCTPEQNVRKIVGLYNQLDLKGRVIREGSPRNGPNVNMDSFFEITIKGGKTIATVDGKDIKVDHTFTGGIVCGDYQCGILNWLDALRASTSKFSEKRTYHDLFNGVEYGAVQSYFGAHQAAVIYPSGTDWKETGTVLDPWYTQEGKAYPIDEWDYLPAPSKYYKDVYPMNGGSVYAADIAHSSIQRKQKQELENKKVCGVIECDIDLRITDTRTGSSMGRINGEFVNTIPDGRFVAHPTGDGENDLVWYFELPEGQYDIHIEGKADGDFHLKTVQRDGELQDYGTCSLTSGSAATLTLSGDDPSPPLILPDGEEVLPTTPSTPEPSGVTFRDDFDGTQMNADDWNIGRLGTWSVTDGNLDIMSFGDGYQEDTTVPTDLQTSYTAGVFHTDGKHDFTGDWTLNTRIHGFDRSGYGDCLLFIMMQTAGTRIGHGIHIADERNDHPWTTMPFGDGISDFYNYQNLDPSIHDLTLKVVKEGNTFTYYTNGEQVYVHTRDIADDAVWHLVINHVRYGSAQAWAKIDYVEVTGGAEQPEPTPEPAEPSLIAYWPADGDANDAEGTHHGTLQNGVLFADGVSGQAFSFDGIDDFVEVPDSDEWAFPGDFSIAMWVKFGRVGGGLLTPAAPLISSDNGPGGTDKWFFSHGGDILTFFVTNVAEGWGPFAQTQLVADLDRWYHVAVTREGDTYATYVDGVLGASETNGLTIPNCVVPLMLGRAEGFFLNGLLDEIKIFDGALSASQIAALAEPSDQPTPVPPTPTFTPTATSAPPTPTFTFTPVPPTPTFTPTPVPGGPTPVQPPAASYTNTFDAGDIAANGIMEFPGTFSGLDPALTSIADVIPGGGERFGVSGNAIRISAQPGEGTLLLIGDNSIPAPNKAVIRAAVYTSTPSAQVFIAIIDVDQNGNLSTDLGLDQLLTTKTLHNRWGFVSAIHESQTGFVKPVVQVVGNVTSCDVYVDNIEVFVLEGDKLYPGGLFGAR